MTGAFDEHMAHVAECQQRAKTGPNENAQQSWLALADSWRHTAGRRLFSSLVYIARLRTGLIYGHMSPAPFAALQSNRSAIAVSTN